MSPIPDWSVSRIFKCQPCRKWLPSIRKLSQGKERSQSIGGHDSRHLQKQHSKTKFKVSKFYCSQAVLKHLTWIILVHNLQLHGNKRCTVKSYGIYCLFVFGKDRIAFVWCKKPAYLCDTVIVFCETDLWIMKMTPVTMTSLCNNTTFHLPDISRQNLSRGHDPGFPVYS